MGNYPYYVRFRRIAYFTGTGSGGFGAEGVQDLAVLGISSYGFGLGLGVFEGPHPQPLHGFGFWVDSILPNPRFRV